MSFELRDHTADIAVEAEGATLGETYAAVADGMAATMCDAVPADGNRFDVQVTAERREAVLFDYLDELIYQRDIRAELPVDNRVSVEENPDTGEITITGSARGVPLAAITAREIKAVTYSEMAVEQTETGWRAYVVFDV